MQTFILVEAINLVPTIFDTDQLSVIRGGSLLLKQAIREIQKQFRERLEALSSGASSGLFLLKDDSSQLFEVIEAIKKLLESGFFANFVFQVEHCQAEDLLRAKEKLYTQMHFHQMRAITVVPDPIAIPDGLSNHPCELEGRRVAARNCERRVQQRGQRRPRRMSRSVFERLEEGRKLRQDLYFQDDCERGDAQQEIDALHDYGFVNDLESLANCDEYPKLNQKIAVLYMDGNKFGEIQRKAIEAAADAQGMIRAQQEFDRTIQCKRSNFLLKALSEMTKSTDTRFADALTEEVDEENESDPSARKNKRIRFETLLWGGDEMLFVLPAWLGFEFLHYFFEQSRQWSTNGAQPLTHAAGLVFCHAKSPIHRIRDLAKSLADTMKGDMGENRKQDVWDYVVLESIDYPGNANIAEFNEKRFGPLAIHRPKTMHAPGNWAELRNTIKQLIGDSQDDGLLSHRQLYRIARAIQNQAELSDAQPATWAQLSDTKEMKKAKRSPQAAAEHRMFMLLEKAQRESLKEKGFVLAHDLFDLNPDCERQRACFWIHLIELWDYLVPRKRPERT